MDKLRSFLTTVNAISVCIALILQKIVEDRVFPTGNAPKIFLLITIPIALIIIYALCWLATQLISRSSSIRHLILRKDFIDGTWRGLSDNDNALVIIAVHSQDIQIAGQVFDDTGNVVLTWRSLSASYTGNELRYLYVATSGSSEQPEEVYGYCTRQLTKSQPHAAPRRYDGYHVGVSTDFQQLRFQGEKITDTGLLKQMETIAGAYSVIRHLANSSQ